MWTTQNYWLELKISLDTIYEWASQNNMKWNQNKFQLLRIGKNISLKDETYYFSPNMDTVVEEKDWVKDLGILVDNQLTYRTHRQEAIRKLTQKTGWIKRTFFNR